MFHLRRIWFALDDLFHRESGSLQISLNRFRREEVKVHEDWPIPLLVSVQGFVADVKREQQQTIRLQNACDLSKCLRHRPRGEIHDGIEGGNAGQEASGQVEPEHVSLTESDIRLRRRASSNMPGERSSPKTFTPASRRWRAM